MIRVEPPVKLLERKTKELGENLPQSSFAHHKSHMSWPVLEPSDLPLSYGTANLERSRYAKPLEKPVPVLSINAVWVDSSESGTAPLCLWGILVVPRKALALTSASLPLAIHEGRQLYNWRSRDQR
jgi:hypothetical protein